MAFPAQINADADRCTWYPALIGPVLDAGNRFVFLPDDSTNRVRAWKSIDGGNTWAQADAANAPAIPASGLKHNVSIVRDKNAAVRTVYVAYMHSADDTIRILPFKMDTSVWDTGNIITGGPQVFAQDGLTDDGGFKVSIDQRPSDGAFIVLYQAVSENVGGTLYDRVNYVKYLAGWGAPVSVANLGEAASYTANGLCLGDSNRMHLLIGSIVAAGPTYRMYHRSLSSGDALGTLQQVATDVWNIQEPHISYPVMRGSEIVVGYLKLQSAPNTCRPKTATATSAVDPVWTLAEINTDDTKNPRGNSFQNVGIAVPDSTRMYAFWVRSVAVDDLYYAIFSGGVWGVPVILHSTAFFFETATAMALSPAVGVVFWESFPSFLGDYSELAVPPLPPSGAPPVGVGGGGIGLISAIGTPTPFAPLGMPVSPPNTFNALIDREAKLWEHAVCNNLIQPKCPDCDGVSPLVAMPRNGREFQDVASIPLPLDDGLDHVVLTFRVPLGYDALLNHHVHFFTGTNFIEGAGQIAWRIKVGSRFPRDWGNILFTYGSLSAADDEDSDALIIPGAGLHLVSGQVVQYLVSIAVGGGLGGGGGAFIVCGLFGWLFPRR
jgi:hypothetical protein